MEDSETRGQVPSWAESPFRSFFGYAAEVNRYRDLCEVSISSVSDFATDREALGEDYIPTDRRIAFTPWGDRGDG